MNVSTMQYSCAFRLYVILWYSESDIRLFFCRLEQKGCTKQNDFVIFCFTDEALRGKLVSTLRFALFIVRSKLHYVFFGTTPYISISM